MNMDLNFEDLFESKKHFGKTVGICLAVLIVCGSVLAYSQIEISEQDATYNTYAMVNSSEGQNLTAGIHAGEDMSFGELVEGTNMTKTLELSSNQLTLAEMSSTGNISEGLVYENQLFVNETDIDVKYVGKNPGYYEGEILLDLKTAQNTWGEKWLELLYRLP